MTQKRKRGRPKATLETYLPRVRCSKKQLDAYYAAAKADDRDISGWIRTVLNRAVRSDA